MAGAARGARTGPSRSAAARLHVVAEGEGVDGISELWFDTREAFEAAYASEHGQRVAADSLAMVSRRERLLVDERPLVA